MLYCSLYTEKEQDRVMFEGHVLLFTACTCFRGRQEGIGIPIRQGNALLLPLFGKG